VDKAVSNPDRNRDSNPISPATFPTSRRSDPRKAEVKVTAIKMNKVVNAALLDTYILAGEILCRISSVAFRISKGDKHAE
jgi:hypothetical protein